MKNFSVRLRYSALIFSFTFLVFISFISSFNEDILRSFDNVISQFSSLILLFRISILHFSIPNSMQLLELNILTVCISESRPLSAFPYNFRWLNCHINNSRWLIHSLLLLNSQASLHFLKMNKIIKIVTRNYYYYYYYHQENQ